MPFKKMPWMTTITFLLLLLTLSVLPSSASDLKPFASGDSLEILREKINHNGYSFTVGNNWVYNMSPAEKKGFFNRHKPKSVKKCTALNDYAALSKRAGVTALPARFDWRYVADSGAETTRSYIGPIRNQGRCGSCYAFAAVAAAEGTYNYAMNLYDANTVDFSEAFLAFCLPAFYSGFDGCDGAGYDYDELMALVERGVTDESRYPYTDRPQSCNAYSWQASRKAFASWGRVACGDIDAIKTAIMTYGVVDAAVLVTEAFMAYSAGIYEDTNTSCSTDPCYYAETDHAIALVGWDDSPPEGGGGVWILRNSWGTDWGENGYMRIRYTSAAVACAVTYLTPGHWPDVVTGAASSVTASTAFLSGTVNPGNQTSTYYFHYGLSPSSGDATARTDVGSGGEEIAARASISGLAPNMTYYSRLIANQSFGSVQSFVTQAAAPLVQTDAADEVSKSTARLNALVCARNSATTYYFEYGATNAGFLKTPVTDAGSDNTVNAVSASVTDLLPGRIYFYRIVAENDAGTSYGEVKTLHTTALPGGGDGSGGGCFIATAAFGSPMEKHVRILRIFRDTYLRENAPGKAFLKFYYSTSPSIADTIARKDYLRTLTRCLLLPFIGFAYLAVQCGLMTAFLIMLLAMLLAAAFIGMRKKITRAGPLY